jgi:hypothetical protein
MILTHCETSPTGLRKDDAMVHFSNDETDFVAVVLALNNPGAIELANQSTEPWLAIEFTIPGHGDTLIYKSRDRFCKLTEHVDDKLLKTVPHLEKWMREKGIPFSSLYEWKMTLTFTSKLPDEPRWAGQT